MNFQLTKEQEFTKLMIDKFCEEVVVPTAEDLDKSLRTRPRRVWSINRSTRTPTRRDT